MILNFSINGRGSNAKHSDYSTQEITNSTDVEELIRSILVDYRSDASHWDLTSFKATVSTYIKDDATELDDYNDIDNELINVDRYDADNTPVEVGYGTIVEYEDDDVEDTCINDLGYSTAEAAIANAAIDTRSMCGDDVIIGKIIPVYYECDAYGSVDYYDLNGKFIRHEFYQGYLD